MDGFKFMAEVKAERALRAIPVVVLTSSQDFQHVSKSFESQAESFITKPLEPEQLRAVLSEVHAQWFRNLKRPPLPPS